MKKSLVALAALAATAAFAQSSVTITGIMDANYASQDYFGTKVNEVRQNGARTTTFKFLGTEDLGGGMSANFLYEVQPTLIANNGNASILGGNTSASSGSASGTTWGGNAANPSGLVGPGEAYVGLKDNTYGEVKLGTINTNTFKTFAAVSQMGTGIGTGYSTYGQVIPSVTRLESAASYDTPVWNGFSAGIEKGFGNDTKYFTTAQTIATRSTVTDYGLTYANGPLTVKYGSRNDSTYATGVIKNTRLLGGVYDAGVAKVSLANGAIKTDDTKTDASINLASVVVPFMGSYRFLVQQASVKYNKGAGNGIDGSKDKILGWGIEKDLSKRTFVYLRAENATLGAIDMTTLVAGPTGAAFTNKADTNNKRTLTAVGISHQF